MIERGMVAVGDWEVVETNPFDDADGRADRAVVERVRLSVDRHGLLPSGGTVIVGVSGGPDSLCLLHVLCRLAVAYGVGLHVAHLNHRIRGPEADADAAFVADLAATWGLPCTVEARDVPALAREGKLALEEAARQARYTFLAAVAARLGSRTVAVAHNADDQVESVIMHLLRGSGLAGLRGMLPLADYCLLGEAAGGQPGLSLVRPLLEVPRADVEAYCAAHGLKPRFDRSNLDTTYHRNRLRHELIPYLESYNPNISEVIRRTALVIRDDYELLRGELARVWPAVVRGEGAGAILFDLAAWRSLPRSLQRATLREAVHRLRRSLRNINFIHVENALAVLLEGETGDRATLPQGLLATLGYDSFSVAAEESSRFPPPDHPLLLSKEPLPVSVPGSTILPGGEWALEAEILAAPPAFDPAAFGPWEAYLDFGAVAAPRLRCRRPGDRFQPLGMGGLGKRLGEFMINEKIPAAWRDHIPLLVSGERIAWVCGYRPDERARIGASTEKILHLRFRRTEIPDESRGTPCSQPRNLV
jgi:tRNA(Ile)-lysidine synthase